MKVLVTGATGFVGRYLLAELQRHNYDATGVVRSREKASDQGLSNIVIITDLSNQAALGTACRDADAVIHLAALAHVMDSSNPEIQEEYFRVNVTGTQNLLTAAIEQGVKKFVFISSIKVNGESTSDNPFSTESELQPSDAYGKSKMDAEVIVEAVCRENGCDWTIVRPPLVYGPGVKANFSRLMGLVKSGAPLPLGLCHNKRALVYVGNLTSLIIRILEQDKGPNCTMLISDGADLSVAELIRAMGKVIGIKPILLPVPQFLLRIIGALLGRGQEVRRLTESLEVNMDSTCRKLNWQPPYSVDRALQLTMRD